MTRISATEVMIEHNSKLARDPIHLRRLVTFWPEENIVHQLAKQALADMERSTVPDGWVAVPIDATKEMVTAGQDKFEECIDHGFDSCEDGSTHEYSKISSDAPYQVFKAMIEAAPKVEK